MKYCSHCGKEILDEAVICPGCGCAVENAKIKKEKKHLLLFNKNKKQWIIALSIIFVVFVTVAILLLTSSGFIRAQDRYEYLHSDLGQLGKNYSTSAANEWNRNVENAKSDLVPYYIEIGASSVLALTALIGDITLIFTKKKTK